MQAREPGDRPKALASIAAVASKVCCSASREIFGAQPLLLRLSIGFSSFMADGVSFRQIWGALCARFLAFPDRLSPLRCSARWTVSPCGRASRVHRNQHD